MNTCANFTRTHTQYCDEYGKYADDEIPEEIKQVIDCAECKTYCFEMIQTYHDYTKDTVQYNRIHTTLTMKYQER